VNIASTELNSLRKGNVDIDKLINLPTDFDLFLMEMEDSEPELPISMSVPKESLGAQSPDILFLKYVIVLDTDIKQK
jgi:hypothetical protein